MNIPHYELQIREVRTLDIPRRTVVRGSDAAQIAHAMIGMAPIEHLIAIAIDGQSNVTGIATVAQGGMHGCGVKAADVLRAVLAMQASAFVLAHNHPSGSPEASPQDIEVTIKIMQACAAVDLPMLDHIIVTRDPSKWSVIIA